MIMIASSGNGRFTRQRDAFADPIALHAFGPRRSGDPVILATSYFCSPLAKARLRQPGMLRGRAGAVSFTVELATAS